MIALDALTERTVTIKNPINPATVKIILMCSVPVDRLEKIIHIPQKLNDKFFQRHLIAKDI